MYRVCLGFSCENIGQAGEQATIMKKIRGSSSSSLPTITEKNKKLRVQNLLQPLPAMVIVDDSMDSNEVDV